LIEGGVTAECGEICQGKEKVPGHLVNGQCFYQERAVIIGQCEGVRYQKPTKQRGEKVANSRELRQVVTRKSCRAHPRMYKKKENVPGARHNRRVSGVYPKQRNQEGGGRQVETHDHSCKTVMSKFHLGSRTERERVIQEREGKKRGGGRGGVGGGGVWGGGGAGGGLGGGEGGGASEGLLGGR